MQKMQLSISLVLLGLLSACTLLSDNRQATAFFIAQGVARYIEAEPDIGLRSARAGDAYQAIEPVLKLVDNQAFTVGELEAVFYSQFDITALEPSDQAVIRLVVSDVRRELEGASVGGFLDDDTRLFVRDLLLEILKTVSLYGL